jgi:two-component system response regulator RegA
MNSGGKAVEEALGDNRRLLLVDDDEILCSVLARALQRRGYDVALAHDYRSALAAAAAHRPGFAVVDLKFPGGSGLCLVKDLVELDPRTRVVVLTGYGSIATAIEAIKGGAHYYLTKPANADDVVAALHRDCEVATAQVCEKPLSVNRLEWEHINRVLSGNDGNVSATARLLGMHRRTLQRKLSKHPVRD